MIKDIKHMQFIPYLVKLKLSGESPIPPPYAKIEKFMHKRGIGTIPYLEPAIAGGSRAYATVVAVNG